MLQLDARPRPAKTAQTQLLLYGVEPRSEGFTDGGAESRAPHDGPKEAQQPAGAAVTSRTEPQGGKVKEVPPEAEGKEEPKKRTENKEDEEGEEKGEEKGGERECGEEEKAAPPQKARHIPVSGFLVDVSCPTEERLSVRVDVTSLPNHLAFLYGLQDIINAVNANYSRRAKPRVCTVRYYKEKDREGKETQRKILEFSPYPSPIINTLKEARERLYAALRQHCLILASEKVGSQKRHLFFLPSGKAADLELEVQNINAALRTLQEKVVEFEASEDARSITEYVAQVQPIELRAVIGSASVNPVPFSLDRQFVEAFVEDARRSLAEIDARREAGLRALEAELEERRRKMLSELEQSMKEKVLAVLDQLEGAIKENRDRPTRSLLSAVSSAASISSSLQLGIAKPLEELERALKAREKPSSAAKGLAITLGAPGASIRQIRERIAAEPLLAVIE